MDTGRAAQVPHRLQNLETVAVEQLDRALLEVQSAAVLPWTGWATSIGHVVYTRVLGKGAQVVWQRASMAQLELDGKPTMEPSISS